MINDTIKKLVSPPRFSDDEQNRVAGVLNVMMIAVLIGLCLLWAYRLTVGVVTNVISIGVESAFVLISIALFRRKIVGWSSMLFLWTLIGFLDFLLVSNDGIHDTAMLAVPGVLVMAGLALRKAQFSLFACAAILSVSVIGYLESVGVIHNTYHGTANLFDVADLVVILGITAVSIHLLSDSLIRSITRAREDEKEIQKHSKQLQASEERYRTLFEAAHDAIFIMKEDRFVEFNNMALTMFGCTEKRDIDGHAPWEFSPALQPDGSSSKEKTLHIIHATLQGTPQRFSWKHSRKDGTLFDTEVSLKRVEYGDGVFLQALVRDVTEQRRSVQALQESEELYRKLVTTVPDIIIRTDLDRNITFINETVIPSVGLLTKDRVLGRNIFTLIAPEDRDRAIENSKLQMEKQLGPREYKLIFDDGISVDCEVNGDVLRGRDEVPYGMVYVIRDITERKQAEEDRKKLEQQLLQSQKLESIGTLATGIAHDFGNILNMIISSASLLETRAAHDDKTRRWINTIIKSSEHGSQLVKQLLTFAKKTEVKLRPVVVNDVIQELALLLGETFPKNIEMTFDLREDLPSVAADPNQIHQVLLNLSVNARDAMPSGGTLGFRTTTVSGENLRQQWPQMKPQTYVGISLTDTGEGIDEATMKRIFDPYFSTKGEDKGTGLGLSVVLGIVERHNGLIDVKSERGTGTEFIIYLPSIVEQAEAA